MQPDPQTYNPGRVCIFCGVTLTKDNRSREHVIPDWLQIHLGMDDKQLQLATATTVDNKILKRRVQAASRFKEGRICSVCNNGWMSKLETESMELLKLLIEGRCSPVELSNDQRASLAKWATKTAFVLSHVALLQKTPSVAQMKWMARHKGEVPPGIWVVTQIGPPTSNFLHIERNQWMHNHSGVSPSRKPPEGSFKIAFQFRYLMLLVAHWPDENAQMILSAGIHIPLWPQEQVYLCRYETEFQGMDHSNAAALLDRFCRSLSVTTVVPE
jgi:hypothetical protein